PATPLNGAIGQWVEFILPLDGTTEPTGWHVTAVGAASLEHIGSVEIHADTWDHGFTLWVDGMGFHPQPGASVVDRLLFYNNSALDGGDPAAGPGDDGAIAADKEVLLPGGPAVPANTTGYSRGVNGIMVDIAGLADGDALCDGDFTVRLSDDPAGGVWTPGPAPRIIAVRPGAGRDDSDRVTLIWSDGVLVNTWVEVTVRATAATGLAADDVFLVANVAGDADSDRDVDLDDFVALKRGFGTSGGGIPSGDFDLTGRVDLDDFVVLKTNFGAGVAAASAGLERTVDLLAATPEAPRPAETRASVAAARTRRVPARRRLSWRENSGDRAGRREGLDLLAAAAMKPLHR
ncbi:MAG: hypothetical protein GX591_18085, partial [Planctomycetes bacterium]|nr:hypothetical protein [Planctomycetota bacterium]